MKKFFAISISKLNDGRDEERTLIAQEVCEAFSMKKKNDFLWEHKSKDVVQEAQGQCADFGLPLSETKIWDRAERTELSNIKKLARD